MIFGRLVAIMLMLVFPVVATPATPPTAAVETGVYRNLFREWRPELTEAEIDARLDLYWRSLFEGDEESRVYYPGPANADGPTGYIVDIGNDDVRSEGMSYGMMIAVQMNLREQFDRLWRFARTYMQYPSSTPVTPWKYYFRWQGTVNTSNASSWSVDFGAMTSPAPDGEEYFAAALYFADQRWGSNGAIDYKREADNIASAMLHNPAANGRYPIIHATQNMVVFTPIGDSNEFTDPSYHLPAFYEVFARYGPAADRERWRAIAQTSRDFLVKSAHPTTGLHPDYATFGGAPRTGNPGDGHDQFAYDAWRVVMNMAVDYAWFRADARMKAQVEKYHAFFGSHLTTNNVANSLFRVDGTNPSGGGSTALTGTLAVGSLVSENSKRETFVANLWGVPQQEGLYRYYQESVYLLALLHVAGKFRYEW